MRPDRRFSIALISTLLLALLVLAACGPKETAIEGHMLVFDYEGTFIPVEQLHEAPADACDSDHWHASGAVTTLQGEPLTEPDPSCGFGTSFDLDVIEVPMPDDYQGIQRTDEDWKFNARD
jgi:hypothetical protein